VAAFSDTNAGRKVVVVFNSDCVHHHAALTSRRANSGPRQAIRRQGANQQHNEHNAKNLGPKRPCVRYIPAASIKFLLPQHCVDQPADRQLRGAFIGGPSQFR
jgi:hypothetical protein